jgi:hypothetical protein
MTRGIATFTEFYNTPTGVAVRIKCSTVDTVLLKATSFESSIALVSGDTATTVKAKIKQATVDGAAIQGITLQTTEVFITEIG